MVRLGFIRLFFWSTMFLVSCENSKNHLNIEESTRKVLHINLDENIKTLAPQNITNHSEKFISELIYEGLFEIDEYGKVNPLLASEYKQDSLGFTYTFRIKPGVSFHNGDLLDMNHMYQYFKNIIDSEDPSETIQNFRIDIKGYQRYLFRKKYNIQSDSLPSGLKIIDNHSFSIAFNKPKPNLSKTLAHTDFLLHSETPTGLIGTGPYILDYSNEDISYSLIKNENYHKKWQQGLSIINIRFIKNPEAQVSEFMNGALDLLIFENSKYKSSLIEPRTKYNRYNQYESSLSKVKYVSLNNFSQASLEKLITQLIVFAQDEKLAVLSTFQGKEVFEIIEPSRDSINFYVEKLNLFDSTPKLDLPVLVKCESCSEEFASLRQTLGSYFDLYEVSFSQINPNVSYLVIEESKTPIYEKEPGFRALKNLLNSNKTRSVRNKTVLVLKIEREQVLSSIMLNGLKDYTDWTKRLKYLSFIKPKTY